MDPHETEMTSALLEIQRLRAQNKDLGPELNAQLERARTVNEVLRILDEHRGWRLTSGHRAIAQELGDAVEELTKAVAGATLVATKPDGGNQVDTNAKQIQDAVEQFEQRLRELNFEPTSGSANPS